MEDSISLGVASVHATLTPLNEVVYELLYQLLDLSVDS